MPESESTPNSGPDARKTSEPLSRSRTEAQRDRDRILYSSAFRRLSGITQVASPQTGQLLHNRLTHTLKVAQVARRLAERFNTELEAGLDPDAVEAGALAHDLGHPPFGHIGEVVLNELMGADGFEGNAQSFRVVTRLSRSSLDYRGLNLTRRVLNATLKYPWRKHGEGTRSEKWGVYQDDEEAFAWARAELPADSRDQMTVEAQIMDFADDITYATHDVEDFFRAGLIPLDRLSGQADERERFRESFLGNGTEPNKRIRRELLAEDSDPEEIERTCSELAEDTEWLLGKLLVFPRPYEGDGASRVQLRELTSALIGELFQSAELVDGDLQRSAESRRRVAILRELTWFYVIDQPGLAQRQAGQTQVVTDLFTRFCSAAEKDEPEYRLFPPGVAEMLKEARDAPEPERSTSTRRVVVDYLAGMAEGEAIRTHRTLTAAQ